MVEHLPSRPEAEVQFSVLWGGVGSGVEWGRGGEWGKGKQKKKPDEAVLGARPEFFCEIHQKCVTFWLITRCTGYLLFEDLVTITWPTYNVISFTFP